MKHIKPYGLLEGYLSDFYEEMEEGSFQEVLEEILAKGSNCFFNRKDLEVIYTELLKNDTYFRLSTRSKVIDFRKPPYPILHKNTRVMAISSVYNNIHLGIMSWCIYAGEDDWFYCYLVKKNEKFDYKCDRLDGLLKFLKDSRLIK